MAGLRSISLLALAAMANASPQFLPIPIPNPFFNHQSCAQVGSGTQSGAYSINCGVDRIGGDLLIAPLAALSFTECESFCGKYSNCQGFVYNELSQLCSLKSVLNPESLVPFSSTGIIPTTSNGYLSTCAQLGASYKGYNIKCGQSFTGGDLSSEDNKSFSSCVDKCSSLPACVALVFRGDENRCYYKKALGTSSADSLGCVAQNPTKPIPTTTTTTRSTTTSALLPTTTSMALSTTISVALPTTTSVALPTTTSVAVPTTIPVTLPTTVSVSLSTTSLALPTTVSVSLPSTTSVALPTTTSVALPTTTSVALPTTTSLALPTTTSVAVPTTTSVVLPTTISVTTPVVPTTIPGAPTTTSAVVIPTTASTTSSTTSAGPAASPGSCQASGSQLGAYTTYCNTDFGGNDLSNAQASSFAACGPICDQTPGCMGFSYVGGNNPGVCYLKSSKAAGNGTPNDGVSSGFKSIATPGSLTTSSAAAGTSQASTSAAGTNSAPAGTTSAAAAPSGACGAVGSGILFGSGYTASCATDFPGSFDSGNSPANSFAACAPLCDARSDCIGYSYVGGVNPGVCYFKSAKGTAQSNPNVDSAFKPSVSVSSSISASLTSVSVSSSISASLTSASVSTVTVSATAIPITTTIFTTANPVTTTIFTSATTPAAAAPSGACTAFVGSTFGSGYTAECQTDRAGGDISNAQASSFAGCAPLCDAISGCIGYSFVGGTGAGNCYFKNNKQGASSNSNVDVAFKPSAGSGTTTTAATTTTLPVSLTVTSRLPASTCLCRDEL
ncbi:unnamed protein product [Zymoseptoria tritici ST99CH_3D7]|uniref:Apple domain-containing protein n=1 Tax=Zymoseptoria tritici (strain ST99CH_3D7) TaxID=1276538 RepID=A0A1X7S7L9_ZYMT9|nr:unnamed protein product [Zymoseptoria tritici ST99CH_3D7]